MNKAASDLEIRIQEIFDWIYANIGDTESIWLEVGIWDAIAVPYTYYAVLKNKNGTALYGESSYDSSTIEDAINSILKEIS